jgi:hypothetical protein
MFAIDTGCGCNFSHAVFFALARRRNEFKAGQSYDVRHVGHQES